MLSLKINDVAKQKKIIRVHLSKLLLIYYVVEIGSPQFNAVEAPATVHAYGLIVNYFI